MGAAAELGSAIVGMAQGDKDAGPVGSAPPGDREQGVTDQVLRLFGVEDGADAAIVASDAEDDEVLELTDALAEPTPSWRALSDASRALERAESREQLVEASLAVMERFAASCALFLVHDGLVQGVAGRGEAFRARDLSGILFPAAAGGCLSTVVQERRSYRGEPGDSGTELRFFQALGREAVAEVLLTPVVLAGRVVNVLYADNGYHALGPVVEGGMRGVAEQMVGAYLRLIQSKKDRTEAADGGPVAT